MSSSRFEKKSRYPWHSYLGWRVLFTRLHLLAGLVRSILLDSWVPILWLSCSQTLRYNVMLFKQPDVAAMSVFLLQ
jgi:hypothetical protein